VIARTFAFTSAFAGLLALFVVEVATVGVVGGALGFGHAGVAFAVFDAALF
jgi:hypothetical protein